MRTIELPAAFQPLCLGRFEGRGLFQLGRGQDPWGEDCSLRRSNYNYNSLGLAFRNFCLNDFWTLSASVGLVKSLPAATCSLVAALPNSQSLSE